MTSGRREHSRPDREFDEFLEEAREKIAVRVFLCGKGIDPEKTLGDLAADKSDKRAYLWNRLEKEIAGCKVLLGEHDHLILAYGNIFQKSAKDPRTINLASFEAALARHVHLIVVFPESAGSFAELGLFTSPGGPADKVLVIIEKDRENKDSFKNSFLARGPVARVSAERGHVKYLDYNDLDAIYEAVKETVEAIVEKLTTQKIFIRTEL